jgi:hypothetical protein
VLSPTHFALPFAFLEWGCQMLFLHGFMDNLLACVLKESTLLKEKNTRKKPTIDPKKNGLK